jgi:hypothetical protein
MNQNIAKPPPVPARLVIQSIVALWVCYFILATLRGAVLGYDFNWEMASRRLLVTVASMLVTALLWPLLVAFAARPLWQRAAAILVAALPAAILLAAINDLVFAELNADPQMKVETEDGISIVSDGAGNMVIDLSRRKRPAEAAPVPPVPTEPPPPLPPVPPALPDPPAPPEPPTHPAESSSGARHGPSVAIGGKKTKSFWEDNSDIAFGRYFLLLAWASIYLALASAEQARAAERREGEFRQAAQAAELRSLRYQINPHFLFNTLNSLSALVLTGRQEAAERMIQMLAGFYRRSLAGDPTGDLTLGEEIALQKLYLEIEAVRFPERLRTAIDVPEPLTDACVPGMILQPLIENSIKHGVAAIGRPVTIAIAAWPEGDRLVLSVSDDGPGTGGASNGLGIGLANVRDRLQARFGAEASIVAGPQPEGGYRTVLRLPLQRRGG